MANAFRLDELDGQIAQVTFDVSDKKVNTLGREVLQELAGLVAALESAPTCADCCSAAANQASSSPEPT